MPGHHDGRGVVCPGCRRMLRLPRQDESTPPLVVPIHDSSGRGRRRAEKRSEEFDETFSHKRDTPPWFRWAIVASFATVGMIVLMGSLLRGGKDDPAPPVTDAGKDPVKTPAAPEKVEKAPHFPTLEKIIQAFLDAPKAEDTIAHVRHPETTAPRIRATAETYQAPGFREAAWNLEPKRQGPGIGVIVQIQDFTERVIWLVEEDGQWKIDWESWVGWCSVPWENIRPEKPAGTLRLRVLVSPAEYFNFTFTDDFEWLCYRLRHPASEEILFGYVRRQSELGAAFQALDAGEQAVIIEARFPEDSPTDNQLLIEAMPSATWLDTTPSP